MTQRTIEEMAVQHAIDMGYPVDTGEHNRFVARYLAGARAMAEMAAHKHDHEAQRMNRLRDPSMANHHRKWAAAIRNLIPDQSQGERKA